VKTKLEPSEYEMNIKEESWIKAPKSLNKIKGNPKILANYLQESGNSIKMLVGVGPKSMTTLEVNQEITAKKQRLRSANTKISVKSSLNRIPNLMNSAERVVGYDSKTS